MIAMTMIIIVCRLPFQDDFYTYIAVVRSFPDVCQEDARRSHSTNPSLSRNGNGHCGQYVDVLDFLRSVQNHHYVYDIVSRSLSPYTQLNRCRGFTSGPL